MDNIYEINVNDIVPSKFTDSLYENRKIISSYLRSLRPKNCDVSISVYAYNNIDKTKRCVESIIKYTQNIDYYLVLVDNGSTDGTFEYFKSVEFERKYVIRVNENKGSSVAGMLVPPIGYPKYNVSVCNDVIVTENWLSNLLKVIKSDPKIAIVCAMSSNTSNFQDPNLKFNSIDEMQRKAKEFNVSDPRKWHERLRLMTLVTVFNNDADLCGEIYDSGYAHNFGDDDYCFRLRRAGYKIILAGDTFVHHDDDKTNLPSEKFKKLNDDLEIGRKNFIDKHYGIDAWEDVNNYIPEYISALNKEAVNSSAKILGIDTKCGTPILELKNYLRGFDVFESDCFAFTSEPKYLVDLQTICGADNVKCGEINGFSEFFNYDYFDHIVIGNDLNTYIDMYKLIGSAYRLLKKNGQLFVSLQNTDNIFTFLNTVGKTNVRNPVHAFSYSVEEFLEQMSKYGFSIKYITGREFTYVDRNMLSYTAGALDKIGVSNMKEALYRLTAERYYFVITK